MAVGIILEVVWFRSVINFVAKFKGKNYMERRKKYDVFISSKSADYHLAEEVYNFLTANGLSVFIASEELKKIGEAQYADAIDEVLDNSVHMVVVASSLDHIKSKWVKYEWSTFSNDLKSGYRDGNLLTILSGGIELKMLPPSLRHQQSFHFDSYKNDILDYLKICQKDDSKEQKTDIPAFPSHGVNDNYNFKIPYDRGCTILLDNEDHIHKAIYYNGKQIKSERIDYIKTKQEEKVDNEHHPNSTINRIIENAIRQQVAKANVDENTTQADLRHAIRWIMRDNPDIFWFANKYYFDEASSTIKFQ